MFSQKVIDKKKFENEIWKFEASYYNFLQASRSHDLC